MSVSNHKTLYFIQIVQQIRYIRNDQINTRQCLIGKLRTTVNHDDVLIVLDEIHILSDFIYAAKCSDIQFVVG
ncbi:hypothetical protein D3C76_1526450 [compost metagenome]